MRGSGGLWALRAGGGGLGALGGGGGCQGQGLGAGRELGCGQSGALTDPPFPSLRETLKVPLPRHVVHAAELPVIAYFLKLL